MCAFAVLVVVGGCGPELDAPSSIDLSGHWTSVDKVGALSNIQFDLAQRRDGVLTGNWSGNFAASIADCPPGIGPHPTGPVNGSNTTLLVRFSLLGAGDFEGQALESHTLRGAVLSCDVEYPIEFKRVAAASSPAFR